MRFGAVRELRVARRAAVLSGVILLQVIILGVLSGG